VGEAKGEGSASFDYMKEGRNYCGGKKAFPIDESSMGGEEKSKRKEISIIIEPVSGRRRTHSLRGIISRSTDIKV
jgi:hypothetical protein